MTRLFTARFRTRRTTRTALAPVMLAAAVLLLSYAAGAEETTPASDAALSYRSPEGIVFRVTADGLASIRLDDRDLAAGSWSVFNAEGWFKDSGSGRVDTKTLGEKSIEVLGERRARVRHARGDVVCTADYSFDGEDLTVSARVDNPLVGALRGLVSVPGTKTLTVVDNLADPPVVTQVQLRNWYRIRVWHRGPRFVQLRGARSAG